jgi:predicted ABC-class ATPase
VLSEQDLKRKLRAIDKRGYKAYKDIEGKYDFGYFVLRIDHAQGDPFASPSRLAIQISHDVAGFPKDLFSKEERRIALCDFITRAFDKAIRDVVKGNRGTGHSGMIAIDRPGQEVLERTSVIIREEGIELRFVAGLPAAGRTVLGNQAMEMLCVEVPALVQRSLIARNMNMAEIRRHVEVVEDNCFIRRKLPELGLVAFLADGSILPRRSGVDDRPMSKEEAIPFSSPPTLSVEIELPNTGKIKGMGIPKGVTLIVGGGYHGKSTLLSAIEKGVYPHIPGDGREFVATVPDAVRIRAEDGRRVEKVDISPFISNLPFGKDTRSFSTDNASGSTSQVANIIEAIEAGSKLFLIDEDTSATNFMIRDSRMQKLVAKENEPITPFIDRVRQLYRELGISTILVMGGSGDYFDVADTVIMMHNYLPEDVTGMAKDIAIRNPTGRKEEIVGPFPPLRKRVPLPESFDPRRGRKDVKINAKGWDTIVFGREVIDLSLVSQIVDDSQTKAIGDMIFHAVRKGYIDGRRSIPEILDLIEEEIREKGFDSMFFLPVGDRARPRRFEIAAAINRMRSLKVR